MGVRQLTEPQIPPLCLELDYEAAVNAMYSYFAANGKLIGST